MKSPFKERASSRQWVAKKRKILLRTGDRKRRERGGVENEEFTCNGVQTVIKKTGVKKKSLYSEGPKKTGTL